MQKEVTDLNDTFDASIELMRQGANLSQQAAHHKNVLNEEFNTFLELLKADGVLIESEYITTDAEHKEKAPGEHT
jgi:hypothetical protein